LSVAINARRLPAGVKQKIRRFDPLLEFTDESCRHRRDVKRTQVLNELGG